VTWQDRKRSKAAVAAEAAAAARVPLVVRMQESVTTGMTRALDSSNKVMCGCECALMRLLSAGAGVRDAGEDGVEEGGSWW